MFSQTPKLKRKKVNNTTHVIKNMQDYFNRLHIKERTRRWGRLWLSGIYPLCCHRGHTSSQRQISLLGLAQNSFSRLLEPSRNCQVLLLIQKKHLKTGSFRVFFHKKPKHIKCGHSNVLGITVKISQEWGDRLKTQDFSSKAHRCQKKNKHSWSFLTTWLWQHWRLSIDKNVFW